MCGGGAVRVSSRDTRVWTRGGYFPRVFCKGGGSSLGVSHAVVSHTHVSHPSLFRGCASLWVTVDAFVAMGGNPDMSGKIRAETLIATVQKFHLTIDIEVRMPLHLHSRV